MIPFRILGPLAVGDEPGRLVRGQLGRTLGTLLLGGGHPVPTGELARWSMGEECRDANQRVHVLVARLRQLLRVEALPAEVVTTPGGYRLDAPRCHVDAMQFATMATAAPSDRGQRQRHLEQALAMWRGDVAEGLGLDDLPGVLELRDLRLSVAEDVFALKLEAGDFRDALPGAVALCRASPERERLVGLVTVALYRAGRHCEALELLTGVRRDLREERGLEPGTVLQALELAILRHEVDGAVEDLLLGAGDGPSRLRPVEPVVVAARSRPAASNVPIPLSGIVGRAGAITEVWSLLDAARVVSLTGAGGVGKTRLALELATRVAGTGTSDAVYWCELAPVQAPLDVVGVVAKVLGATPQGPGSLVEAAVHDVGDRRVTLVLDNCEHLLGPVADLVEELCRRCPRLRVLATSREPLGVGGEHTYVVRPLGHVDSVSLFTERARAVRSSFAPDDATKEICRRLDGIPLALEMAAARVRSMQPSEIAARLDERFRFLVGARRATGRHETLRATVGWSHGLLDDREQRVFRRLAVFASGFDLSAVEAVAADDELDAIDVDAVVHSLVSKSLVVSDRDRHGETRYTLLETIREFAREQLAASDEGAYRRHLHAIHLSRFVSAAGCGLRGQEETVWADRVALELDNLRAAFVWSVEVGDADLALGLFAPLPATGLADTTAHDMFTWIDAALGVPGADTSRHRWQALMWVLARAANLQEFGSLERYLDWARANDEAEDVPELLSLVALWNHAVAGDLEKAARLHRRASLKFAEVGDQYHAVRAAALDLWCRAGDDIDAELEVLADQARALRNPYMSAFGLGAATCAPGNVLRNPARALELLDEASAWGRHSRNPFLHRAIAGARILALTLLGDMGALNEAKGAITSSRNLNQIGVPVGALSVACALAGHHHAAAELIGATTRSPTVFNPLSRSGQVSEIWDGTRRALGPVDYERAVERGAARSYEDLVDWLSDTLEAVASRPSPPPPHPAGELTV